MVELGLGELRRDGVSIGEVAEGNTSMRVGYILVRYRERIIIPVCLPFFHSLALQKAEIPVIFLLSVGADPTESIEVLARRKKVKLVVDGFSFPYSRH